jgi:twitching motility protein PilT
LENRISDLSWSLPAMNEIHHHHMIKGLLRTAVEAGASDIHLMAGERARMRVAGELVPITSFEGSVPTVVDDAWLTSWSGQVLNEDERSRFQERGSFDGALSLDDGTRLRFNLFRQAGRLAAAFRRLESSFLELRELGLNEDLYRVCQLKYGLVIIAGPTGSGKSTTLATLIHRINQTRAAHIITIEDPVEYIHRSQKSLVSQRQVGVDSPDFLQALIDSLRQDPDVILIGEIRDLETIRTAITAAETGHLVFATVHAGDCIGAIERLISVFPADEQAMVQKLLGMVLRCVVTQHLVPAESGTRTSHAGTHSSAAGLDPMPPQRVLVSEILWGTVAVANLIASGQTRQIASIMETGTADGMLTMDACLAQLLKRRRISEQVAKTLAKNPGLMLERSRR